MICIKSQDSFPINLGGPWKPEIWEVEPIKEDGKDRGIP